jgi:hypothetical protein
MKLLDLRSRNLEIDWICLNIEGLPDPELLASGLSKHFIPHVLLNKKPFISYHGFKKKHQVSIRQYTGSKGYWVGTQIIFSGKNAAYFYKLIKLQKLDWSIFRNHQHILTLGRIDLCYSRGNDPKDTLQSFDGFLTNCRSQIQKNTTTKHIKLVDFPNGKMLKVNRRNNSVHYRIYQKKQSVRFELELKHRQTKLIQDHLFKNQLTIFEDKLVHQFYKSSGQFLRMDSRYSEWIVDFQRQFQGNPPFRALVTSYLNNQQTRNQKEAERLYHLLQFLSFVNSLNLNPFQDCKRFQMKTQIYYELKFPLSQFLKFTNMQSSNQVEREKIIDYFSELQMLDPIVKVFSNKTFRSYVCFPYVDSSDLSGKYWIEVLVAEELLSYPYPFQLPKSFLRAKSKNDLRLKLQFLKALAINTQEKELDIETFFNGITVGPNQIIKIKTNIIQLLKDLEKNKVISDHLVIQRKSGSERKASIKSLSTSDITRRIKYLKFTENLKNRL